MQTREGNEMATYTITESVEENWNEQYTYKYRYRSRDGHPVAQEEIDRRRASGQPAVLWRWENQKPMLIENLDARQADAATDASRHR